MEHTSPAPYLIIRQGWLFSVEFLPQKEGEALFVSRDRLPRRENRFTSVLHRIFPFSHRGPELAYGMDGMVYEIEFETLPEHYELGEKPCEQYDWWDWLSHAYDVFTSRAESKPAPVRYHLKSPEPYDFAELRALVAGVLRKDGDCYSQFGADTQKAAEHVEKTRDFHALMVYFSRRKFLWLDYAAAEAKSYRERLKQWCTAATTSE